MFSNEDIFYLFLTWARNVCRKVIFRQKGESLAELSPFYYFTVFCVSIRPKPLLVSGRYSCDRMH